MRLGTPAGVIQGSASDASGLLAAVVHDAEFFCRVCTDRVEQTWHRRAFRAEIPSCQRTIHSLKEAENRLFAEETWPSEGSCHPRHPLPR